MAGEKLPFSFEYMTPEVFGEYAKIVFQFIVGLLVLGVMFGFFDRGE